jgi:hypothetical protein
VAIQKRKSSLGTLEWRFSIVRKSIGGVGVAKRIVERVKGGLRQFQVSRRLQEVESGTEMEGEKSVTKEKERIIGSRHKKGKKKRD